MKTCFDCKWCNDDHIPDREDMFYCSIEYHVHYNYDNEICGGFTEKCLENKDEAIK